MTHSNSILELKRKSIAMGLCGEYKDRWDSLTTPKELVDLAIDINGADFVCSSAAKGWGVSKKIILQNFSEYINGNYVARTGKNKDYTSEFFVGHSGKIIARTTILIVLYSDGVIYIPKNHVCRIFVAECSNISIQCDGFCELANYTPRHNIKSGGNGHIVVVDPKKDSNSWMNFSLNKDEDK